jgi:hypothetical protein
MGPRKEPEPPQWDEELQREIEEYEREYCEQMGEDDSDESF